jgi:hypothetical protein
MDSFLKEFFSNPTDKIYLHTFLCDVYPKTLESFGRDRRYDFENILPPKNRGKIGVFDSKHS